MKVAAAVTVKSLCLISLLFLLWIPGAAQQMAVGVPGALQGNARAPEDVSSTQAVSLFENFETGTKTSYAAANVTLSSGIWNFNDALIGNSSSDHKNGTQCARVRNGKITMTFDVTGGAGMVTVYHALYGTDASCTFELWYSTDAGTNWTKTGSTVTTSAYTPQLATFTVNVAGTIRFELRKTDGSTRRINFDDFTINSYSPGGGGGTATVFPDSTFHGVSYPLALTYYRDTAFALSDMRLILPDNYAWSHDSASITYTNMSAVQTISGDTITFNGITLTADSTVITIQNVTAPDSTAIYPVHVQTTASTQLSDITTLPRIFNFGLPVTIAEVKGNDANGAALRTGQLVTVRGILTVGNEFGGPSYIQDNTAGMAIFGTSLSTAANIGDEVIVSGIVNPFNGLMELNSPFLHSIVSSGNVVTPLLLTCSQVTHDGAGGVELYEGMLVRVNHVYVTSLTGGAIGSWTSGTSGTNYRLTDPGDTLDIRVDNNVNFANTPSPSGIFDVVGVVSQFKSGSPYIGGYQLMPRALSDIIAGGPVIATFPIESNITPTSFRISWTTINSGASRLRYGITTAYELGVIAPDNGIRTSHAIDVTGLTPATIYHVQAFSWLGPDTSFANDLVVSTASLGSTGEMNVYFNRTIDTSVSTGEKALGNQDFVTLLVNRINNAHRSIDAALYSLSANGQGDVIANALVSAKNRGVSVRVICEYDNSTSGGSSWSILTGAGIPLITDRFDAVWNGAGLMHDKFFVIDGRLGGAPDSAWVRTGSWNPTLQGTVNDRQNVIEIQDLALAKAYVAEFDQMWGSSTSTPNASTSRFGGRKLDITPHHFVINGTPVSLYFSPSDHTTSQIAATLSKAQSSIANAILTFTRADLADTLITKKNAGKKVRVVLDNNTDTGNQYATLFGAGVDIHMKGFTGGLLHHKYALVDADQSTPGSQYTITGSHNWSGSAENSNDENTLIVQSARIANLYLQEFAARYYEAGGTDSIHTATPPPTAPAFSVAPASLNFDTLTIGQTKTDSVTVSNPGTATLNVTAISSTNTAFTFTPLTLSVPVSSSRKLYVTFTDSLLGAQSGGIILTHNATGSPDTVPVFGFGIPLHVDSSAAVSVAFNTGWNMLSLPVTPPDTRKSVLFPSASSNAFAYGGTYVVQDTLVVGKGYWVKFPAGFSDTISGIPMLRDSIPVAAGWNMIGSLTSAIATSSIGQVPGGLVSSSYFGFNGSYVITDSILPGKAYWIKATQPGVLVLSSSGPVASVSSVKKHLEGSNRFTIGVAAGPKQTLYVQSSVLKDASVGEFELPPVPPEQAGFDARFASGRMLEIYSEKEQKPLRLPIHVQTHASSIVFTWSLDSHERNSYTLVGVNKNGTFALPLKGSGTKTLSMDPAATFELRITPAESLPLRFMLGQNYPNPFNPLTRIPFALPQSATVTLSVYSVLGNLVRTVVDRSHYDAGWYDVPFDGSSLASGVYFYRVEMQPDVPGIPPFVLTQKLLLLK